MENKAIISNFYSSIQEATIEILGRQEAKKVFNSILGPDWVSGNGASMLSKDFLFGICDHFSIQYQLNTARGLLMRIGDAAFLLMRKNFKVLNELGSIDNRLRPFDDKFESSVQSLADFLAKEMNMPIKMKATGEKCYCLYVSRRSPTTSGDGLDLYFLAGILRAFGEWLDSRRDYQVTVESLENNHLQDWVCLSVRQTQ